MKVSLKRARHMGLCFMLVFAVAGCDKKATGQVVAVVNGEEISLQELNAELNGAQVPESADKKAVMRQLLQRVIDRRLLAQAAKEQGLDRDPAFIQQQRRMNEDLLVRLYAKKASDGIRVPDTATIDKYIADNPAMFGGRARYTLDQIQFPMPADQNQLKQLADAHTLAAAMAKLDQLGIKYERGTGALDSAIVPPELLKQVLALPPGEPFVVPAGGKVVVSVVTGKLPVTLLPEQSRPMAVQAMRAQNLGKIGETRLKDARAAAKIEYQPTYEPTAAEKKAAAPPAPKK